MSQTTSIKEHKRQMVTIFDPDHSKTLAEHNRPKRKRVAAYARVSTELDSQQNSYEAQINYYTEYIKSRPEWEFVAVYADEGITGTSYRRRDGFNKMVQDAMNGKTDLILTKSISRFARNTVDALTITRRLKAEGIEVFFEKENISSMDNQAELIFTIMSSVAQEESRSISENVRWGIKRSMEAGKFSLPWKHFLGFERGPDGLPQIVEDEAKIVREIYRSYLNGKSLLGIAKDLTAHHVKTPCDRRKWSPETIRNILTNEKYKGDAVLQKTYTVDFLSKEIRRNNGERKQWYIHDSHDAIITSEAFKRAQIELKRRREPRGKHYNSPFTSRLICGECGTNYNHRSKLPDYEEKRFDLWACDKAFKTGACSAPMIPDRKIKKAVTTAINRLLVNYTFDVEKYQREILTPVLIDKADDSAQFLRETNLVVKSFDPYPIFTLIDAIMIKADHIITVCFKNAQKEAVNLHQI